MDYRDKQFKSKLRTHGGAIRKKVKIYEEKIGETYRKTRSTELGDYRHNEIHCNYDTLIKKVVSKWEERDEKLCLEIIHSLSNKVNSLILEVILSEHEKIVLENVEKKNRANK